jgi:small subunit ribosomal protein S16
MSTKIRLQLKGKKHKHFFHIVVAQSQAPRDGRFIEKIGTFNPITKQLTLNFDRYNYWKGCGAQSTERVITCLKRFEENSKNTIDN